MEVLAVETKPLNTPATESEAASLTTTLSFSWCKTCYNLSEPIAAKYGDPEAPWGIGDGLRLDRIYGGGYVIYITLKVFKESVSAGCFFCEFLERTIDRFIPDEDETGYLQIELRKSGVRVLLRKSKYNEYGVDVYRLADSVSGGSESVYDYIPARRHIGLPNSEQSMNYLKSCIKTCTEKHDLCRQDPLAQRPKRLLDIGSVDDDVVKLHETSDNFREPYVALSYCWGKAEFLKAKKENLQFLKQGFNSTELPESIRDAIHLVRELGLRYLWVDSLCIVQPDGTSEGMADWLDQSAKMCSIYEQAYLTIAASSVSSADESFLRYSSRPPYLQYDVTSVPGLTLVARVQCTTGHHLRKWLEHPMPVDPTDKRGWVLQEYLLSTRMISYSTDELQWRCKTTSTVGCELIDICECQEFINFKQPPVLSAEQSELEVLERWNEIVTMYTNRRLTNQDDKFPALSGICELVEKQTGWQYLAGMWNYHFLRHLLWTAYNGVSTPLPSTSTAPSFSWASLDCPVIPYKLKRKYKPTGESVENLEQEYAELIDFAIMPLDDNPFGRIKPGSSLTLKGKLVHNVEISDQAANWPFRYGLELGHKGREYFTLVEDVQLENFHFIDSDGLPQRSVRRFRDHTSRQTVILERGSTVSLFLILSQREPDSEDNPWNWNVYYMLALGVSPFNHNAYERLGVCTRDDFCLGSTNFFDNIESQEIVIY